MYLKKGQCTNRSNFLYCAKLACVLREWFDKKSLLRCYAASNAEYLQRFKDISTLSSRSKSSRRLKVGTTIFRKVCTSFLV
jgi:hypothetical protein